VTPIPTFREVEDQVGEILRQQGALAAVLVDLEPLARIERSFGGTTYQSLRAQVDPLMREMKEKVLDGDILTRDEREGDRFLLLLGAKRSDGPFRIADLRRLTDRVEEFITPRVARLTAPYLRERSGLNVGYGFVVFSPLESPERQILRLIDDALQCAELRAREKEREQRETLVEIIHNRSLWTAFQPIVEIESRQIMGHEGLSRGPRGSELEPPIKLFGLAGRCGLVEELERACRRQAFQDWAGFGDKGGRLFINTVPATVRDPTFVGRGLLDYLGEGLSPRFVTLEITEGQVIENLNLYREAMHPFIELGFSFAIDDVGAGYSGLETIANLGATYLKIDMGLVRDVHQKRVSQQVVKAIRDMAQGTGATVIAEGIQTLDESNCIVDLGIRYGQGYYFARPIDPLAHRMKVVAKGANP
jgi:EAL domain-containing protein (putative c-di-GMP-specific phosphodiesterase class I)